MNKKNLNPTSQEKISLFDIYFKNNTYDQMTFAFNKWSVTF